MSEVEIRKKLMSELLTSVQQCQVRYGGKSELATESEEVVSRLCRCLEYVFSHGLKSQSKQNSTLKQMTDLVSNNLGGFLLSQSTSASSITGAGASSAPVLWSFIKVHLNRHELERYMLLKSVNTEAGRGRAWLRAALNEHSLERYVHLFLSDQQILEQHYEPFAFIRDEERSSMLPSMAAGLGSILFAITIDNLLLNTSTDPFAKSCQDEMSILASTRSKLTSSASVDDKTTTEHDKDVAKKKKKPRKSAPKIVDFDESDMGKMRELREASVSSDTRSVASAFSMPTPSSTKTSGKISPSPSLSYDPIHLSDSRRKMTLNKNPVTKNVVGRPNNNNYDGDETDLDIYSRSSVDDSEERYLSTSSSINLPNNSSNLSTLTPIRNVEIGALIPLSSNGDLPNDVQSEDSASAHSFGEESDYGSVFTELPPTPGKAEQQQSSGKSVTGASLASSVGSAISREDLKQALLSVMSRKDELQSQCTALKKLLEQESSVAAGLQEELKEARRRVTETSDKLGIRIQTLARENELLKHQLKKYVGAVQKLRDGPMAYETLAQLEGQSASAEHNMKYVDYHFEASEFEKKLIQVAEMHGELLEFNEHLQKTIQAKDSYIRRLRDELVELRGPLPNGEGDQQEDAVSLASEAESMTTSIMSTSSQSKFSLINIWVPSVFLSGTGSRTHHVYQVYLKIAGEEWNVYRRYSEFYALHKDLQQRDRSVGSFDFPPKKTVGYKADKVVEDRRKRLQAYLRCVVNLMVQMNPSLLAKPDKEHVLLLMPFFAEASSRLGHSAASPSLLTNTGSGGSAHRLFHRHSNITTSRGHNSEPTPQLAL